MKLLEDKILSCGTVLPGEILKVDNFLNHQLDVELISALGEEFFRIFQNDNVTKILTVESSGIALAFAAAQHFHVPVVFAKKGMHKNVGTDCYAAEVYSYTKGQSYIITVSRKYLSAADRVLLIDDFLANGAAANGMIKICGDAGAAVAGIGIAIEKGFQPGGQALRDRGFKLASLAIVDSMTDTSISFRSEE